MTSLPPYLSPSLLYMNYTYIHIYITFSPSVRSLSSARLFSAAISASSKRTRKKERKKERNI